MKDHLLTYKGLAVNQDDWSIPYQKLHDFYEEKGYRFLTNIPEIIDEEFDKNVRSIFIHNVPPLSYLSKFSKNIINKLLIIITEPPHICGNNINPKLLNHYKKILTFDDQIIDNKKYYKYHFVQSHLKMIKDLEPFDCKKLCTLIASNKNSQHKNELYSQRRNAISFFEKKATNVFDLYGKRWGNRNYISYRGTVASKTETLKKYKFCLCYENITGIKGYITEKIFGCFIAGCVPIYWGADNITDYIPENCFIDKRKFESLDLLYDYITSMDETTYNIYLKNIKKFLCSNKAQVFSTENFIHTLVQLETKKY